MKNDITTPVLETLNRYTENLVWWNSAKPLYEDLIDKLESYGFDTTLTLSGLEFCGTGGRDNLVNAFKALRAAGFSPTRRPEAGSTYFGTYFHHPDLKQIWLSYSSTVCRRVQVGTRVEEVPVYEVKCDEDMVVTETDEEQ